MYCLPSDVELNVNFCAYSQLADDHSLSYDTVVLVVVKVQSVVSILTLADIKLTNSFVINKLMLECLFLPPGWILHANHPSLHLRECGLRRHPFEAHFLRPNWIDLLFIDTDSSDRDGELTAARQPAFFEHWIAKEPLIDTNLIRGNSIYKM